MAIPWQAPNSTKRGILQPGRDDVLTHDDVQRGLDQGGIFDWGQSLGYESQSLENWLQHYIAAVAGIEASLVRPRWQLTPPNIPDFSTPCWISIGITRKTPIGQWAYVGHNGVPEAGRVDRPPEADPILTHDERRRGLDRAVFDRAEQLSNVEKARRQTGRDQMIRWEDFELLTTFYGPECEIYSENLHSGLMVWQNRVVLRLVGLALVEAGEQIRMAELVRQQMLDRVDKTIYFRRVVQRSYPVFNLLSVHGVIQMDHCADHYSVPFNTP